MYHVQGEGTTPYLEEENICGKSKHILVANTDIMTGLLYVSFLLFAAQPVKICIVFRYSLLLYTC